MSADRDLALLEKVGMYYVQYRGIFGLEDLRGSMGSAGALLGEHLESSVRASLVYVAVPEMVRAIEDALGQMTRELVVDRGPELLGALLVPQTLVLRPSGQVAYMTTTGSRTGREYAILGAIARRVAELAGKYLEEVPRFDVEIGVDRKLREELGRLEELIPELPSGHILPRSPYDPDWLRRSHELLELLDGLVAGVKGEGREGAFVPIRSVLYELLTVYLILGAFERRGFRVHRGEGGGIYVARRDGRRYRVFLNSALEGHEIVKLVDELGGRDNEEAIARIKGRPDVSLVGEAGGGEIRVAFECKYSDDPGYVAAGRFKVMAYMYEYGLRFGVLVFPDLGAGGEGDQDPQERAESQALLQTLRNVLDRNELSICSFHLKDGRCLYMLRLDPRNDPDFLERQVDHLVGGMESDSGGLAANACA